MTENFAKTTQMEYTTQINIDDFLKIINDPKNHPDQPLENRKKFLIAEVKKILDSVAKHHFSVLHDLSSPVGTLSRLAELDYLKMDKEHIIQSANTLIYAIHVHTH